MYKYAFKYPKKVFFQNEDDKQLFVQHNLIKYNITEVLPGSGVDLKKFYFSPKNRGKKFIFLMISRVLYDKGVKEYYEAAKLIKSKSSNVEFQLLGTHDVSKGSLPKNEFQKWIDESIINYLGTTDNVAEMIRNSDCVVLPSYREGTPKTLLEALATGRPIITTNVPGCKETVLINENGYLCEPKNSNDLANKMFQMLDLNDSKLSKMAIISRELAEQKFDEQLVVKKYIDEVNGV